MTLRISGALLCGAVLVIAAPSSSFAQLGNPIGGGAGNRVYGPGQAHYGSASRNKGAGNVKYETTRAKAGKSGPAAQRKMCILWKPHHDGDNRYCTQWVTVQ